MASYVIKSPAGRDYVVNAPEGATEAQVLAFAKSHFEQLQKQTDADMAKMADPTSGMSGGEKFAAGFGKAIVDTGRGLGQMVRMTSRDDVSESRKLDKALMETGAGMAGNVLGNVAINAPLAMIPGAGTMRGAAAIGAASGLAQPSTSNNETLSNVMMGAGAGAAIPAAVVGAKVAKSFVDPLYQGGREKIIGGVLRKVAGNEADQAANNMRTVKSAIPGVQYTAAEAAGNPGVSALQRTALAEPGVALNDLVARQTANNDARVGALRQLTGSEGDRDALAQLRSGMAEDLYKQAYSKAPNFARDATTGQFLNKAQQAGRKAELTKLMETPSMQEAWKKAQRMMADDINAGRAPASAFDSVKAMDYTRRALSDMVGESQGNQQRILIQLRDRLDTNLQSLSPKYLEAKNTFAEMSKPITEMDVVKEIAGKSISPNSGNLQPNAYARALQDKTAASVSGMRNATLESTIKPESLQTLNSIKQDLQRLSSVENSGRVGSDTVQKMAYGNMLDQAGVPTAIRGFAPAGVMGNLAARVGQTVYKDANEKMAQQLAQALLNPTDAADLMMAAKASPQVRALIEGLKRTGVAAGATLPALAQPR